MIEQLDMGWIVIIIGFFTVGPLLIIGVLYCDEAPEVKQEPLFKTDEEELMYYRAKERMEEERRRTHLY